MKASASIVVNRSVAETFNAFSDIPNRAMYLPAIIKLKIHTLQTGEKGVEWFEERMEEGIKKTGTLKITTYNQPKAFTITTKSSGLIFKTRYNFQNAGDEKTKVVVSIGGRPKGILSGIMNAFLAKSSVYMGQQLKNDLDSYKTIIETNPKVNS